MSVTPGERLAGILPVVISGGRPRLRDRTTAALLHDLHGVTRDPVWLVRDDRAGEYERDGHETVTFPRDAAEQYAAAHWIGHEPYRPGAFLGCFTEREWACRLAAQRGCWAVLQLDDNLLILECFTSKSAGKITARVNGGLALFADIFAAVALSTNGVKTGAHLSAVDPRTSRNVLARPGYPYSLYLERTDTGRREPYYGPIEEDILQTWQYLSNATSDTSLIVNPLRYTKCHRSQTTGMRAHYDSTRSVGLQRVAPEMARLTIVGAHACGEGPARVFHRMPGSHDQTPMIVTDPVLYGAAAARMIQLGGDVLELHRRRLAGDLQRRAARAAARG